MKNGLKVIRIGVLVILLLILMGKVSDIIVKYVDTMKIRNILTQILFLVFGLFVVILAQNKKMAAPRVTILDIFIIGIMVIVLIVSVIEMRKNPQ